MWRWTSFLRTGLLIVLISGPVYSQKADLVVQTGHTNAINALAFSPDGGILASGSHDFTIKLWDVRSGLQIRTLKGHVNTVTSLIFSRSQNILLSGSLDGTVRVWRIDTGAMVRVISQSSSITSIALSPDGLTVACVGWDHKVWLWNVANGSKVRVLTGHGSSLNTVAFSPDGKLLASAGDDNLIKLWEVRSGNEVRTLTIKVPDKQSRRLIDSTTGKPIVKPTEPNSGLAVIVTDSVNWVSFSPDGKKLASLSRTARSFELNGIDFSIKIWDVKSGKEIRTLETFSGGGQPVQFVFNTSNSDNNALVGSIAFTPDGRALIARSADYMVGLWDVESGKKLKNYPVISFGDDPIKAKEIRTKFEQITWKFNPHLPTLSPDGRTFAIAIENMISIWDVQAEKTLLGLSSYSSSVNSVAFDASSRLLADSTDATPTRIWDLRLGQVARTLYRKTFPAGAFGISFSPKQNMIATISPDIYDAKATVEIWDSTTGELLNAFSGAATGILSLAFSPDGSGVLVSRLDNSVAIWDPIKGQKIHDFSQTYFKGNVTAFSPDGKVFAHAAWGSTNKPVPPSATPLQPDALKQDLSSQDTSPFLEIRDVASGREIRVIRDQDREFYGLAFSPNNLFLAAGASDGTLYLWNVQTGEEIHALKGAQNSFYAVTFSPDGEILAAAGTAGLIYLWNVQSGKEIGSMAGHSGAVRSLAFSKDGRLLASGGTDGAVRIWDVALRKELAALFPLGQSDWAVVDALGRFDTSDPDHLNGLAWVFSDEPLKGLAPEIFMRDYFTPQLLSKLVSGHSLREVPPLASLIRVQPAVRIVKVTEAKERTDSVDVVLEVASERSEVQKDQQGRPLQSGVYDVRLFRDGHIVGQWPEISGDADYTSGAGNLAVEREVWRRLHEVKLDADKTTITFRNIRLPQQAGSNKVVFTAYAFNRDRVKSATTPAYEYTPSRPVLPPDPRAYLITMGVNANQSYNLNLELAVSSAEKARTLLRGRLQASYPEIVEIQLYSDFQPNSNRPALKTARKADLRAVMDLLAGQPIDPQLRDEVDPKHQLRPARPDDSVILYVASHGYADPQGTFYLMPYDTGPNAGVTDELLTWCQTTSNTPPTCMQAKNLLLNSISSADLAAWWKAVDAKELVMILDACHSGAVSGREFRPGPLGDPGFGQLSYDKGMQILTASQPVQTERGEWITGGEGRTLLVDALERVMQAHPQFTVEQSLRETAQQLPKITQELYPALPEEDIPLPVLLDFARTIQSMP